MKKSIFIKCNILIIYVFLILIFFIIFIASSPKPQFFSTGIETYFLFPNNLGIKITDEKIMYIKHPYDKSYKEEKINNEYSMINSLIIKKNGKVIFDFSGELELENIKKNGVYFYIENKRINLDDSDKLKKVFSKNSDMVNYKSHLLFERDGIKIKAFIEEIRIEESSKKREIFFFVNGVFLCKDSQ